MSIIRATSNPENLYMIHTKLGRRMFVQVMGPTFMQIPASQFNRIVLSYVKRYRECDPPIICKDLILDEVTDEGCFKKRLTYKSEAIVMWHVTWEYIVNDVMRRGQE